MPDGVLFSDLQTEALIFCAPEPLGAPEIRACLQEMAGTEVPLEQVSESVARLQAKYRSPEYAFEIVQAAGGYKFLTKPECQGTVQLLLKQQSKKRLSTSAVETLSIVAYKHPVTKAQLEQIRGVNCDYALQKLLERSLVEIKGKADGPGRPLLYAPGKKFMEYFGINSLNELPQPKDFSAEEQNELSGNIKGGE